MSSNIQMFFFRAMIDLIMGRDKDPDSEIKRQKRTKIRIDSFQEIGDLQILFDRAVRKSLLQIKKTGCHSTITASPEKLQMM